MQQKMNDNAGNPYLLIGGKIDEIKQDDQIILKVTHRLEYATPRRTQYSAAQTTVLTEVDWHLGEINYGADKTVAQAVEGIKGSPSSDFRFDPHLRRIVNSDSGNVIDVAPSELANNDIVNVRFDAAERMLAIADDGNIWLVANEVPPTLAMASASWIQSRDRWIADLETLKHIPGEGGGFIDPLLTVPLEIKHPDGALMNVWFDGRSSRVVIQPSAEIGPCALLGICETSNFALLYETAKQCFYVQPLASDKRIYEAIQNGFLISGNDIAEPEMVLEQEAPKTVLTTDDGFYVPLLSNRTVEITRHEVKEAQDLGF
ncbi:Uncharacterised protein [BD1-7 clade bacterium]|uniref:Uncharacterized protein n=1 Tax=BD1-7 clade bacterium TaxID=2029982 RepID=A0A5S9QRA2_9GAMM|nr:Uncharacterised protein [BD1-7 clade bacterium]CAA0120976.1 Uncharacterised protein [BD1-7 clade bacterium]